MKIFLVILIGYSAGVVVGGAVSAFIALLEIIPRLVEITDTREYFKLYEWTFIVSSIIFSFLYFVDFSLYLNKYTSIFFGVFNGIFVGLFTSALAEVLNVIPVLSKKFNLSNYVFYLIVSLIFGKVLGSMYYWLVFIR